MENFISSHGDVLRAPIDSAAPVGEDLRGGGSGLANYRSLRDARSQARDHERQMEAAEAGADIRIMLCPEWENVRKLAVSILSEHGKDVEVLVWLTEAETRIEGYAGLAASARLIADLVRIFGTALQPEPEEPGDDRFAALAGLNGVGREGTLIQPLRLLPLVPGAGYGQCTLWDVESGTGADAVRTAMQEAGQTAMRSYHADIIDAISAIHDCDAVLNEVAGAGAPPFTQIINVLDSSERTIRRLAGLEVAEPVAEAPPEAETLGSSPVAAPRSAQISSREEAFELLLRIAAYFRHAEPHSPIAHSLETLVRRGRLDFLALIEELIPDESMRQSVMKTAGIQAESRSPDQSG